MISVTFPCGIATSFRILSSVQIGNREDGQCSQAGPFQMTLLYQSLLCVQFTDVTTSVPHWRTIFWLLRWKVAVSVFDRLVSASTARNIASIWVDLVVGCVRPLQTDWLVLSVPDRRRIRISSLWWLACGLYKYWKTGSTATVLSKVIVKSSWSPVFSLMKTRKIRTNFSARGYLI